MDPSSLTKTSFSGKTVDNVTNNELKEFILNDMKLKCGGIQYNSRYAKVILNTSTFKFHKKVLALPIYCIALKSMGLIIHS